jgi:rubrerythrin
VTYKLGIEEALDIAMDAEQRARDFYAQASLDVQDLAGRDLLGRLAAFEQYHYEKLLELVQSLQMSGQFIAYETQSVQRFAPLAATVSGGIEGASVPDILSKAIDNEKIAGERYRALAETTADPAGRDMFKKLTNEEQIHQRLLEDEFFSLSNRGVWGWSGMYGE